MRVLSKTTSVSVMWTLPGDLARTIVDYAQVVAKQNGASATLAEDIAQITIIRIDEAAGRNPGLRSLLERKGWRGYVATATRNVIVGHHRSEARRLTRETTSSRDQERLSEKASELQLLESAVMLEQLSNTLNEEEQLFVHLRWFQGLPIREIATHMGLTEGRTWHFGQGVLTKLRRRLGPSD